MAAARNGAASLAVAKPSDNHAALPATLALPDNLYRDGRFATPLPSGWTADSMTKGSSNFRIVPPEGMPAAQATLAVVATAPASVSRAFGREQRNVLGGLSFTDLRRTVIDRMISTGGWVVNDRQREIGGHRVFEVIAQTPASSDGRTEQVWNFYFTEINGRIYSLTTHTGSGFTERLAADAEKFLSSFRPLDTSRNK